MITRRQIRIKVMQAIYACDAAEQSPKTTFDLLLKEVKEELEEVERKKKLTGDTHLLEALFFECIKNAELYDTYVIKKAENWELERIAKVDRVLMHMGICEMLNFEEIPVKVTINEYLELAKIFSTPKSSRFINGILDSLFADFNQQGLIVKKGRGLINHSGNNRPKSPRPRRQSKPVEPPKSDVPNPPDEKSEEN
ncbi:MAG: transcription antitermination factor NusB [Bacteroidota bacterium]